MHLGDAAAVEFRKLLADKLAGLVPAERSAPLPPALQSWRSAEALLQDDRRFGALPRSGRWVLQLLSALLHSLLRNLRLMLETIMSALLSAARFRQVYDPECARGTAATCCHHAIVGRGHCVQKHDQGLPCLAVGC